MKKSLLEGVLSLPETQKAEGMYEETTTEDNAQQKTMALGLSRHWLSIY